MNTDRPPPPARPAWSLQLPPLRWRLSTKVLVLAVPALASMAWLVVVGSMEVSRVHQDLLRLEEEDRESELTRALLVDLDGAASWASRAPDPQLRAVVRSDVTDHLGRARSVFGQIERGGSDPSTAEHQRRENDMLSPLTRALDRASAIVAADDWLALPECLRVARRHAEVLDAEATEEAAVVAEDLDRRIHDMASSMTIVAGVVTAVVVLLALGFWRLVLRPLRRLHDSADALRVGRHLPIATSSRDELGRLTAAFDAMAERVLADQAELERRVEQRTRELIRAARLADLGVLAAGIAHEINNPLGSIAAGAEGLRAELVGAGAAAETLDYLDLVIREAYRAKEISSRLLSLARSGPRAVEPVWLAREAEAVRVMLDREARGRGVTIAMRFDPDLPPIDADPSECRQVFYNVLRNALDVAPRASEVTVTGRRESDRLVVRVRDRGPGFPEDPDRVFEPFFTTKGPNHGTGLGLAIVAAIVDGLGGTVTAVDQPGGGELVISLPWPGSR